MIGILVLGQKDFARGLISSVVHTFGTRPPQLEAAGVDFDHAPEAMGEMIAQHIRTLDQGEGVLILADIYGTTHTNLACRLLKRGRIELVSGANLPMLLRVLNYRHLRLDDVIDRALAGGCGGIVCAANPGDAPTPRDNGTEARQ
ncbi:MAG: PTS sugar transporter subunit IIA [Gammaproteobacteria bacterium]